MQGCVPPARCTWGAARASLRSRTPRLSKRYRLGVQELQPLQQLLLGVQASLGDLQLVVLRAGVDHLEPRGRAAALGAES